MLNSCFSTWLPNMMQLENSSLLFPMYKGGLLVVLQDLSMYSCRGLFWNSQSYSSCCLMRDLSRSSTLDNLVFDSAHTPMSSSIFIFSCKVVSRTIQTFYFNNIRSVLKCLILSRKSSTVNSSAVLTVSVSIFTRCPTTTSST